MNNNNSSQLENTTALMSINPGRYLMPIPIFTLVTVIYMYPIASVIGFVLNVPCLIVLLNPKLKGDTYKYLLFKLLTHMGFLFIMAVSPIYRCSSCLVSLTLFANLIRYAFTLCALNVLTTYATLIEIVLSYDRLIMLMLHKPKYLIKLRFWPTMISLLIGGFVFNIPYMFLNRIEQVPGTNIWLFLRTEYSLSAFYRSYAIFFGLFQAIPTLIVIIVLNVFVKIEFSKYLLRKNNLTAPATKLSTRHAHTDLAEKSNSLHNSNLTNLNDIKLKGMSFALPRQKKDKNNSAAAADLSFTMMILVASLLFTVTRFFFFMNNSVSVLLQQLGISHPVQMYFGFLSFFTAIVYYGSNIFTFLLFNKAFRACFRDTFHI
jgi:hypothetical protein